MMMMTLVATTIGYDWKCIYVWPLAVVNYFFLPLAVVVSDRTLSRGGV